MDFVDIVGDAKRDDEDEDGGARPAGKGAVDGGIEGVVGDEGVDEVDDVEAEGEVEAEEMGAAIADDEGIDGEGVDDDSMSAERAGAVVVIGMEVVMMAVNDRVDICVVNMVIDDVGPPASTMIGPVLEGCSGGGFDDIPTVCAPCVSLTTAVDTTVRPAWETVTAGAVTVLTSSEVCIIVVAAGTLPNDDVAAGPPSTSPTE